MKNYLWCGNRILLLLILVVFACSIANAKQIKLSFKDVPLKTVLKELASQSGYSFAYSDALKQVEKLVTCDINSEEPIENILNKLFKGRRISYTITGKQIVLVPEDIAIKNEEPIESKIHGVISDELNEPLVGVTVQNIRTQKISASDLGGNYSIDAKEGDELLFTSIGFTDVKIIVAKSNMINVVMKQNKVILDEVMVVAYGTAKKGTYTGSAAIVDEKAFIDRPLTEVSQALTGTTAGLQVGTSNGMPGSTPTLRIRGIGSFNASNAPLIVLDGMPYDNSFTSINPTDIESITVLKDASSSALYGARAANGVILINTKKGKKGKTDIGVRYNIGFTTRQTNDYATAGMNEYMELYWEATRNSLVTNGASLADANAKAGVSLIAGMAYNAFDMEGGELFDQNGKINPNAKLRWADDLDWRKEIERIGIRHDASFNISGANEKTDYYASVGYMNEEGYMMKSMLNRYSAKANINSQVKKWLKTGVNLNAAITQSDGGQNETSGNLSNPFRFLRYIGNIYPIHLHNPITGEYVYDNEGNKLFDFGNGYTMEDGVVIPNRDCMAGVNHVKESKYRHDGYKRQTINAKTYVDITFLKDFKFSINAGLGANSYRSWSGAYVIKEKSNAGSSTKSISNTTTWTFNQILSYNKDINKHHVDVMLGHESYDYEYNYLTASMKTQTIVGDNFEFANFSEINSIPNSYTNTYKVEGYLSRINYDFDNKYFVSASYRRDGSSRFHKDARWGNFWSVGAGWRIDRENFMRNVNFINMLKLRISYGIVGNDDLDSYYPWQATYSPYPNGIDPGYLQSSLGNKNLSWEESRNLDIGLEFSMFSSKLNGTIELFNRESSNLLFEVPKPYSTGISSVSVNAGSMYNRGIEVTLDYNIFSNKNLSWNINANTTILKNKLSELPLEPYTSTPFKIEAGHSRYEYWLKQWYGVNPDTGYNLFLADIDNEDYVWGENELIEINGKKYTENIEHAKYEWSGEAMPLATGGFGSSLSWKNWSFSFNFYYQLGGKYYDNTYRSLMSMGSGSTSYTKLHKDLIKRWQKVGDNTNVAKLTDGSDSENINASTSTRWLISSNMLELTNVNISYSLPKKLLEKININGIKLYFSADNSLMISKRRGMFPRKAIQSGYFSNGDVYLPSRTFSFGLNINF